GSSKRCCSAACTSTRLAGPCLTPPSCMSPEQAREVSTTALRCRHGISASSRITATRPITFRSQRRRSVIQSPASRPLCSTRHGSSPRYPSCFLVNNSTEYWNRSASLIHTDPMGQNDLPPDTRARIYLLAGAQHYSGQQRDRGIYANCVNPMNHYRAMRALLVALDRWVRDGSEPPPSTYPRIADGTLVTVAAYKVAFPRIPGLTFP